MSVPLVPYEMILIREGLVTNVAVDLLAILPVEIYYLLVAFVAVQVLVMVTTA